MLLCSQVPSEALACLSSLRSLIGNTPLLALRFRFRGTERTLHAKAEYLNLTGSIKDRMALHLIECAYADGSLQPGDTIVEATSGNTGIALAAIGRALGHPVVIYMPDWMSRERVLLIESYGATVVPVSKAQGGFLGSIALTEQHAAEHPHTFLPRQFANQANCAAHRTTTGPEIRRQLRRLGLTPDAFVAGVGTGGTIMGAGADLRAHHPGIKLHPVEPIESPTLSTGYKVGQHRIQGISDEFIPEILDLPALDRVLAVSDGDSILMAQKIARVFGLGVGISSGCNFLAAVLAQESLGPEAVVATIFCDDNKKYISTNLFAQEPVRPAYVSQEIELLDFSVVNDLNDRRFSETPPGAAS
jgi:cysteine synthase A